MKPAIIAHQPIEKLVYEVKKYKINLLFKMYVTSRKMDRGLLQVQLFLILRATGVFLTLLSKSV
jgi:hypothetical protein